MKRLVIILSILSGVALFAGEPASLTDDALKSYLIGTWTGEDDDPDISSEQTFHEDGTYDGQVVMKIKQRSGAKVERRLVFSGVWRVEGDICIETTQKLSPQIRKMPDAPRRYRITDVSSSRHRSTNVETQDSSVHLRKRIQP